MTYSTDLFGDLDTTDGTQSLQILSAEITKYRTFIVAHLLEVTVDGELTGGQGTDHEETGRETSE
jgi:hypothetical protein